MFIALVINPMLMNLRDLLLKALKMEEQGEFEGLTQENIEIISDLIHRPQTLIRDDAAKFLGVSLNHFYILRDQGIVPTPRKVKGLKEKMYYLSDLKKALPNIKLHNK